MFTFLTQSALVLLQVSSYGLRRELCSPSLLLFASFFILLALQRVCIHLLTQPDLVYFVFQSVGFAVVHLVAFPRTQDFDDHM